MDDTWNIEDLVETSSEKDDYVDTRIHNKPLKNDLIESSSKKNDYVSTKIRKTPLKSEIKEKTSKQLLKDNILRMQKEKDERRAIKYDRRDRLCSTNPIKYYKEFSKKPCVFRELYASSEEELSSSSESESESSDDFPSPDTPRKGNRNKQKHQNELFNKIKELQKRVYELEIQNKKLKAGIYR